MTRRLTTATRSSGSRGSLSRRTRARRGSRLAAALGAAVALVAGSLVVAAPLLTPEPAQAVFAEGGEGKYRSSIDWFSFGEEGQIVPSADGTVSYSNDRVVGHHTLRTTCTIGNIVEAVPTPGAQPLSTYRSGWYQGDGLSQLYNIGGAGWSNQLVNGITNTTSGANVKFRILCGDEILDEGGARSTPIELQGLVVADAESSNEASGEFIEVDPITNTAMAGAAEPAMGATWRVIDRYRPAACATNIYAAVDAAQNGLRFQPSGNECIGLPEGDPGKGPGPMAMGFMEGATSADVTLNGGGSSAVAIGMVIDTDFGDAPESYGEAGALFSPTWSGGEIPLGTGSYVSGDDFVLGTPGEPAQKLGTRIDSEVEHVFSWDALLDDESPAGSESDEDALDVNNPPAVNYEAGETTDITLACTVAPGEQGFVAGWIDWARNGTFEDEDKSGPVECVNGEATLSWVAPAGTTAPAGGERTFLRLRIAENPDELQPVGMSSTGEVEDYALDSPLITAVKTSDPVQGTVLNPGSEVTYTLTFQNESEVAGPILYSDQLDEVFDNATLTAGPTVAGPPGVTAELVGTQIDVAGTLAKGETATVSYTVRVNDTAEHGQRLTNHLLLNDGNGTIVEEPQAVCLPENPRCTDHPIAIPELEVTKLADPPSGETVSEGQRITYQVLFHNWGSAPAQIDWLDDLGDVLDDADWGDSLKMSGGLDAAFDPAAKHIAVTGTLGAGDYSVMRYTVIVKDDAARAGNNHLANYVIEAGETPPEVCDPATLTCTEHEVLVADISAVKSADPATGESVVAGQELTYTLEFTNNGATGGDVSYIDDLTAVLDDADFVEGSIVAPDGWTIAGPTDGKLAIDGSLAAGASATVSYKVKVKAEGDRGDDTLANFLFEEGVEPPTTCEPGDDSCTTHPVGKPALVVSKQTDPESGTVVAAGEKLAYTLTFDNSAGGAPAPVAHVDDLSGVLDDATLDPASIVAGDGLTTTGPAADGLLHIAGEVAAGAVVTVTYEVTVKDAAAEGERDHELANFLLEEGAEPPTTCEPGDDTCTTHPVAELVVTKASDPDSGEAVVAGEEITYKLTFENRGGAAAEVDYTDDLSGVLDDADLVGDPTVTPAGSLTGAVVDGKLGITGSVPAGVTAVVSYTVKVKADGERGDNSLANFLLAGDEEPPTTCEPGSDLCTVHPVPELTVTKTSNPDSGEPVIAGQELSYTLTFTNAGAAPATVNHLDDLTGVLDDAAVSAEPVSDLAPVEAKREGANLTITGAVPAGATAKVTYSVIVGADGERGDDVLANFVIGDGETPPTECLPGDDDCTTHPVLPADVGVVKTATPGSGEEVVAGQAVDYTLTFHNAAEAPGDVDYTDDLADVLDDAGLTIQPAASDAALTPALTGSDLRVTGRLQAGQTVTVTYQVTVNADGERGNDTLGNVVVVTGEEPPTTCEPEDDFCTTHPVVAPDISVEKSADPESGTVLLAGDAVEYTLTFRNTGDGAGEVDFTDTLANGGENADLQGSVTVSDPSLTATASAGSTPGQPEIRVTGTLAPGAEVTVTYSYRLQADLPHGARLTNFLTEEGETVPGLCLPENPRCTDHPTVMPGLDTGKSSTPASTETVAAGQEITYTLTFSSWGPADSFVDFRDSLSDVLDDAELTAGPTASGTELRATVEGDAIAVLGTVPAGKTVTVSYTVTVKSDADRLAGGNNTLANYLIADGGTPPTECLPEDWNCTVHPVPNVQAEKSSDPASGEAVTEGQELSYTLTFENSGTAPGQVAYRDSLADVLDDADYVAGSLTATGGLTATGPTGEEIVVTGELAPGAAAQVSYRVKVKPDAERESEGNNSLANYLFGDGDEPPTTCEPGDDSCTVHPTPDLVVEKSADPATGTAVIAGQELSYTLTFENRGTAAGSVAYEDRLAGVLDDAELVGDPQVDADALSATLSGDVLAVAGTLEPGAKVHVTYTVRVKADGDRGDDLLANFVLRPGQDPPAVCDPAVTACTEHPVGQIVAKKSVDPANGTEVVAGQKLTYTLSFENVGRGVASVAYVDDLSDVLDDAKLTGSPTATGGLTVTGPEGDALTISGTLAAGERATVQYEVTVAAAAEAGNGKLANFLVTDGQQPPTTCEPGSETCTENPVQPPVTPGKPSPPVIGETGGGSQLPWLIGGGAVVLLGAALLLIRGLRKRSNSAAGSGEPGDDTVH